MLCPQCMSLFLRSRLLLYSCSMVQIIHFKQTATRSHRWVIFMPTRSSFGPFLFCLYTSKSQIITTHDVSHHMYADDTQVYIELSQSDTHQSISSLSDCLTDISLWMESSKLNHFSTTGCCSVPAQYDVSIRQAARAAFVTSSFKIFLTQTFLRCGATCYILPSRAMTQLFNGVNFVYRSVEVYLTFCSYL